ncbi:MAG: hypothetical protein LUF85_04130 [Bacteroides sp.]|nr:hypothetical protein [Bacteroides sp.]
MWELDKGNPIKDEADWIVRSRYNVVSEKAVVAQMIGRDLETGSGSGNATNLYELLDVNDSVISAPAGSLLSKKSDGTWGYISQSAIVPDLTGYATQSWITSQGYLTATSASNSYVKKTGDTITGALTANLLLSGTKTAQSDGKPGFYASSASYAGLVGEQPYFEFYNTSGQRYGYLRGVTNGIRLNCESGYAGFAINADPVSGYKLYVNGNTYLSGTVYTNNLYPAANAAMSLGNYDRRWSNLWVNANVTVSTSLNDSLTAGAGVILTSVGNIHIKSATSPGIYFYRLNSAASGIALTHISSSILNLNGIFTANWLLSGNKTGQSTGVGFYASPGNYAGMTGDQPYFEFYNTSGQRYGYLRGVTNGIRLNCESGYAGFAINADPVSGYKLYVNGNSYLAGDLWAANVFSTGAVTAQTTSDRNAKYDFQAFDACQVLLALGQVMRFRYKETHQEAIGLVYQDVVGVLPQMDARRKEDKYGSLNYLHSDYINLIAASCQQTIQKVETIRERVDRLERENGELKQHIEQLEHTYHAGK